MQSKLLPSYDLKCAFACALLTTCLAAQEAYPLPSSAIVGTLPENTAPFLLPARCVQTKLADRNTLEVTQNLPLTFAVWDMLSIGPNSRYLFVPTEVPTKAGIFRFDTSTGNVTVLMIGNGVATLVIARWNGVLTREELQQRLRQAAEHGGAP